MRVPLLDFRDKLEDCLEARGAQDTTLDRASDMIQWVERIHRCGIRYLARQSDAYRKTDINLVALTSEKENSSFLDCGGQSLAVAGPQALEKAFIQAKKGGMGLSVLSDVSDLIGVGQLVNEAVEKGYACFASFVVNPLSEEGQLLTEIYGHSRGIIGVPGTDETLHIELYGLPVSHDAFIQGISPENIGDLLVSVLSKTESLIPGCTLLCLDLPNLYENISKGLEAGIKAAPARLYNPADLEARNRDIAEEGYDVDEQDWKAVLEMGKLFSPPEGTAEL
ncbi:hypothetical protein [Kiloniella antarctica]|uniref:HpcH/HpaI aldolase/citrate lyase domain-containing protein n=1 Tax=Kiloniella antarctica TaxID=1550907 RepID=A0ABW5BMZ5_9PROT